MRTHKALAALTGMVVWGVLIATAYASPAYAGVDLDRPVVTAASRASAATVSSGDTVKFRWTVEEASALTVVEFWVYGPQDRIFRAREDSSSITRSGSTLSGTSSITVDAKTWPAGDYRVDFIALQDDAGNSTDTRYNGGPPLKKLTFAVTGTKVDLDRPVVTAASRASAATVSSGDTVKFRWTVEEASALTVVEFWVYGPQDRIFRAREDSSSITRSGSTLSGTSSITVDAKTWPAGDYRVDFIALQDDAGNSTDTRYNGGPPLKKLTFAVTERVSGSRPAITGTARLGATLRAVPGTWMSGTTLSYQWFSRQKAIVGATKATYVLAPSDVGATVTVRVTGTKSGYASRLETSAPSSTVAPGVLSAGSPSISGTAKVGATLIAKTGTWTSGSKFTYQWYADAMKIRKATGSTLKLTSSHAGKRISVKVTGANTGYTTTSKTSSKTERVR
ncbi:MULTISPECIES: hypothetical protein [unclassified Microbacterium]|uniref:hypothetical protein n=1 Tax=unclassified Microbacterium TaxID=2609290 RepID=UPI003019B150